MRNTKLLVVGVGSRIRGDDMVGPFIVDLLQERLDSGEKPDGFDLQLIDADVMPENFSKPIRESGSDLALFVDAVDMNIDPGELRRVPMDLIDATIPCSHNLPMSYIMGYVNERIEKVELVGVQIISTGLFQEIAKGTAVACRKLAGIIWNGKVMDVREYSRYEKGAGKEATNDCW